MNSKIYIFSTRRYQHFKIIVLLCLLCLLVFTACGSGKSTLTPTAVSIPIPTIVPSHPCGSLAPGESIPFVVTGVPGSGVVYSWSVSAGSLNRPDGPAVTFTSPETSGDVLIKVVAEMDGQTSDATINCVVSTPVTLTPTISPMPNEALTPGLTQTIIRPTPTDYPELKVAYEIVPCYRGEAKIKVTLYPTGGNGEYLYTASVVFNVQIDDTKKLVVTSGDGQIWAENLYISKNLMRSCISVFESGGGGGGGGGEEPPPP